MILGQAFSDVVAKVINPKVLYTWFDFHHECRKMKYENIGHLIEEIKGKIDNYDYFMAQIEVGFNEKEKLNSNTVMVFCNQQGVIRTNCVDCLDRTNAV